jgi:hypothetical protein
MVVGRQVTKSASGNGVKKHTKTRFRGVAPLYSAILLEERTALEYFLMFFYNISVIRNVHQMKG